MIKDKENSKAKKNDKPLDRWKESPIDLYIPYACHLDDNSLVTKNGEVLQIIKITGFSYEQVGAEEISLRDAVRRAIFDHIPSNDYALWFHTLRRKQSLAPDGQFPDRLSDYINRSWNSRHKWNESYINQLFITIVRDSIDAKLVNPMNFLRGIIPSVNNKYYTNHLEKNRLELNEVVDNMENSLKAFGARRLGIEYEKGVAYSEPIKFLGKILNLVEENRPMPEMDISDYLPTHRVSFGSNTLQVAGESGKHYGAILTVKEYRELSVKLLDKFLQLPVEFLVSQCIDFINGEQALAGYQRQAYLLGLSGDDELAEQSGLNLVMGSNQGRVIDFGEQQLTIMIIEHSQEELEKAVNLACDSLHELGIVVIREDIRMEDCYWAQLPGNFAFVSRLQPINTRRVAGFASLYNFPAGKAYGNYWGNAVSVFRTAKETPYFFNFHHENNGNTAIIGPYGSGKTVLMNFLVAQSRKFRPKLYYLDYNGGAEIFINAVGGNYIKLSLDNDNSQMGFNPLNLPYSDEHYQFLVLWLKALVNIQDIEITEQIEKQINDLIKWSYNTLSEEHRNLTQLYNACKQYGADELADALEDWIAGNKYGHIFDNSHDELHFPTDYNSEFTFGFDLSGLVIAEIEKEQQSPLVMVVLYLIHRIHAAFDERPDLVVIDEAWRLLDNEIIAPLLEWWLEEMEEHNAALIMATESAEDAANSQISSLIFEHIATQIYLPNNDAGMEYQNIFGLTEQEFDMLLTIPKGERQFLLKHADSAVLANLSLEGMNDIVNILSARPENVAYMYELMEKHGRRNIQDWLKEFINRFKS